MRKQGAPMSDEDFSILPSTRLITNLRQFCRTDFGGTENKERVALQRLIDNTEFRDWLKNLTPDGQKWVAYAAIKSAELACESSRRRLTRTIDELAQRLDMDNIQPENVEKYIKI